jgi:glycogen operon protein
VRRRYADTIVYEMHVKGFTMRHRGVPKKLRGTYAGLAHEASLSYLTELGVTAVELLPIHQNVPESFLPARGLTNYWGYNTVGYLAPHNGYSAAARAGQPGGQVAEFKAMVNALHGAGLEVLLDVVFNHTAEAGQLGPTLCFRGLDNPAYYRLDPADPGRYIDTTGCGNSLNAGNPRTLQLIMDSLRYWITEMHVDGYRFDLAPTLARQDGGFDQVAAFFDLVSQDPVVSPAKLIAEPWDVGQLDSYDLGRFPALWREWNGKYRDSMRDFWRSHPIGIGEFATRFCGSSDLYGGAERRRPTASVNLITVHDGFTLRDLVSYNDKHNEANLESNRDGTDDNRSWNCGVEGPTTDAAILALRERQSRAMLTTLLLSFGVPMLLAGDEAGRTQQGNNNAYCQDNEITWLDWSSQDKELLDFTRRLIAFRKEHPVFRRRRFLAGMEATELGWFTVHGAPMTGDDWADPGALSLGIYLDGSDDPDRAQDGSLMLDDDFLVLINAWWEPLEFVIPAETRDGQTWRPALDSYDLTSAGLDGQAGPDGAAAPQQAGDRVMVGPRSVRVLRGQCRGG